MLKIALGVIAGFLVWSILWVGSDQLIIALSPNWYGKHQNDFAAALKDNKAFVADSMILIMNLMRSVVVSVVAGLTAAAVARENTKSTLILGVLLLAFGTFVEVLAWNYLPVWYHAIFLLLLIPVTIFGGKLRKV